MRVTLAALATVGVSAAASECSGIGSRTDLLHLPETSYCYHFDLDTQHINNPRRADPGKLIEGPTEYWNVERLGTKVRTSKHTAVGHLIFRCSTTVIR